MRPGVHAVSHWTDLSVFTVKQEDQDVRCESSPLVAFVILPGPRSPTGVDRIL